MSVNADCEAATSVKDKICWKGVLFTTVGLIWLSLGTYILLIKSAAGETNISAGPLGVRGWSN